MNPIIKEFMDEIINLWVTQGPDVAEDAYRAGMLKHKLTPGEHRMFRHKIMTKIKEQAK